MTERLQKIIAAAGIASRRAAEQLIREGRVSVNGVVVTELGVKADPGADVIRVNGARITVDTSKVYLILHKPAGYLTAMSDSRGRKTVADLIPGFAERLVPVGRLDYASEGLLIMTNDGYFSYRLQHPKFAVPKTYRVKIRGSIDRASLSAMRKGISLSDGFFIPREVDLEKTNKKSTWLRITIEEGRYRIVRRYLEAQGFPVVRLIRMAEGNVELGDLKPGEYRFVSSKELKHLGGAGR
ncbi:MAG TPA: rRNA pseudouridine synthase [Deltaproteobacteria bacterium]|nr:rRNA pseudouridine synthase [Deltaproteobacteria bacterium]